MARAKKDIVKEIMMGLKIGASLSNRAAMTFRPRHVILFRAEDGIRYALTSDAHC